MTVAYFVSPDLHQVTKPLSARVIAKVQIDSQLQSIYKYMYVDDTHTHSLSLSVSLPPPHLPTPPSSPSSPFLTMHSLAPTSLPPSWLAASSLPVS